MRGLARGIYRLCYNFVSMDNTHSATILGKRYQVLQSLGSGGMALVFRARDILLERSVAVKVLRQNFSQNLDFRERFRQEALAAANLSHPNIVTVHDFGYDEGKLFIVMEYIPGTDLKTILKKKGAMGLDEAIPLIVQACAGIGYAHRAGLIHCDVKPHNMLVTPDSRLKVTDFGIARALSTIHPEEQHEVVWGSPQYFSPEVAGGGAPSPASDVYSLGVILYEMLTGQLPFTSTDPAELARLHRDAFPIPARQLNPTIPPALEQILLKVLQKEPGARYRTADQLGRVLVSFSQMADPFSSNIPALGPIAPPRAEDQTARARTELRPPPQAQPAQRPQAVELSEPPATSLDWKTISLALVATLAVGGLIPFWLYVGFSLLGR